MMPFIFSNIPDLVREGKSFSEILEFEASLKSFDAFLFDYDPIWDLGP